MPVSVDEMDDPTFPQITLTELLEDLDIDDVMENDS